MALPRSDGSTLLSHLESVEKSQGAMPPAELLEYRCTRIPKELAGIYSDFNEISRRRTFSENGPNPISFVEIEAWSNLVGTRVSQFRLDLFCKLDGIWLRAYREANKQ